MKRTIYKITTVLLVASFVAIGSCSDDFVDVASQDENSDEYFNSEEDYLPVLTSNNYDSSTPLYLSSMSLRISSIRDTSIDVTSLSRVSLKSGSPLK